MHNTNLKDKYPRTTSNNTRANLSSVGISCFNSDVEFAPIKVGTISGSAVNQTNNNHYHNNDYYYYPLSLHALFK